MKDAEIEVALLRQVLRFIGVCSLSNYRTGPWWTGRFIVEVQTRIRPMTGQFGSRKGRKSRDRCVWRPLVGPKRGWNRPAKPIVDRRRTRGRLVLLFWHPSLTVTSVRAGTPGSLERSCSRARWHQIPPRSPSPSGCHHADIGDAVGDDRHQGCDRHQHLTQNGNGAKLFVLVEVVDQHVPGAG
jgi:hypothetical protein